MAGEKPFPSPYSSESTVRLMPEMEISLLFSYNPSAIIENVSSNTVCESDYKRRFLGHDQSIIILYNHHSIHLRAPALKASLNHAFCY